MSGETFRMHLPMNIIGEFCRKWKITQLSLFGSALRDDFTDRSDLDLLATFAPEADWSLLDHVEMEQELGRLLGRRIDLISRDGLVHSRNWLLRKEILQSAQVVYEAG
jgi:predicted nucleotidyltransferase